MDNAAHSKLEDFQHQIDLAKRLRDSGLLDRFVEAYVSYHDDNMAFFIHEWSNYLAGVDTPCPETDDGLHQVTSGSCDMCGSKNRS